VIDRCNKHNYTCRVLDTDKNSVLTKCASTVLKIEEDPESRLF